LWNELQNQGLQSGKRQQSRKYQANVVEHKQEDFYAFIASNKDAKCGMSVD
jgi:hypothetical protein